MHVILCISCRIWTNNFLYMSLIDSIIERAKSNRQRIVLPESLEERTITAADRAIADGLAEIILIGIAGKYSLMQRNWVLNILKRR